jgi:hypothetical protein
MADIHGERIEPRLAALKKRFPDKVNVSADENGQFPLPIPGQWKKI